MDNQQKNRLALITLALAIFTMAAVLVYYMYQNQELKKDKNKLLETKIELETEIRDLNKSMDKMEQDMTNKDIEVQEKDNRIQQLSKQLEDLKYLVNKFKSEGKLTQARADQLKSELEQKDYYIRKYQNEINLLKEENQKLKEDLNKADSKIKEKDSLNQENSHKITELSTQVEAAKILKANNFKFYSVKNSGKESEFTTLRSRKLDDLKICFDVIENEVADMGKRNFYVVIKPSGAGQLKNLDKNSGYFTYRNQEILYSTKANAVYNRTSLKVCAVYNRQEAVDYSRGTYAVAVYADGYEIGKSTFTLE